MKKTWIAAAVACAFAAAPLAVAGTSGDAPIVVAQATPQQAAEARSAQRDARAKQVRRLPSERVEARLAYARTALKITDAQQPHWENFANVLRRHAKDMDQRFQQRIALREAARGEQGARASRLQMREGNAIERLERRQQRMADHSARLSEVLDSAKPLYAALSPEQKQIADGMLARQAREGHRHQHRGARHRGA